MDRRERRYQAIENALIEFEGDSGNVTQMKVHSIQNAIEQSDAEAGIDIDKLQAAVRDMEERTTHTSPVKTGPRGITLVEAREWRENHAEAIEASREVGGENPDLGLGEGR